MDQAFCGLDPVHLVPRIATSKRWCPLARHLHLPCQRTACRSTCGRVPRVLRRIMFVQKYYIAGYDSCSARYYLVDRVGKVSCDFIRYCLLHECFHHSLVRYRVPAVRSITRYLSAKRHVASIDLVGGDYWLLVSHISSARLGVLHKLFISIVCEEQQHCSVLVGTITLPCRMQK
jgi:hypothetical protein